MTLPTPNEETLEALRRLRQLRRLGPDAKLEDVYHIPNIKAATQKYNKDIALVVDLATEAFL